MTTNETLLAILKDIIPNEKKRLLEIGAQTGEMATLFNPSFPKLEWIVSSGISGFQKLQKTYPHAVQFEVGKDEFPKKPFDYVLISDAMLELSWKQTKGLIKDFGHRLREGSQVFLLGNYRYADRFLNTQDEKLDQQIKTRNPQFGLRSFEDISECMKKNGLDLYQKYESVGEKHLLVFTRINKIRYEK